MHTGLFFGSFNPIHLGHLAIAQYILNTTEIDRIRFIVSPHNPFKTKQTLLDAELRLDMVKLSIADNSDLEVSDMELRLAQPSYTAQTLREIEKNKEKGPFTIVMGSDTYEQLPDWKEPEYILTYPLIVYKRSLKFKDPYPGHKNVRILDSPILDISATRIRELLAEKKEVKYLVRDEIINLLKFN